MTQTYVLFHAKKTRPFAPCMDGLFAAHAAQLAIPDATLVPAMYGHPPHLNLTDGDRVYLLDLTYPASVLEQWADRGAEVVVLDHHKSAMEDLAGLSNRVLRTFDMGRSGAVIAWEYFHPGQPIPELFSYVQDRDLWMKQLPGCDLVSLGLSETLHSKSLDKAIALIPSLEVNALKQLGQTVEADVKAAIAHAIASHETRCFLGYIVPFFRCRTARERQAYSDIGNALAKQVKLKSWIFGKRNVLPPFAIVQVGGGLALRSHDQGADVSAIAKQIGGGGHRNASGAKG